MISQSSGDAIVFPTRRNRNTKRVINFTEEEQEQEQEHQQQHQHQHQPKKRRLDENITKLRYSSSKSTHRTTTTTSPLSPRQIEELTPKKEYSVRSRKPKIDLGEDVKEISITSLIENGLLCIGDTLHFRGYNGNFLFSLEFCKH